MNHIFKPNLSLHYKCMWVNIGDVQNGKKYYAYHGFIMLFHT